MKIVPIAALGCLLAATCLISNSFAVDLGAKTKFDAPHDMTVAIEVVGPYSQTTDLQIICVFKHKPGGDTYIDAMKDFDSKLGGILSALRNRGEFSGELGETISFTPPPGTITPAHLLVVGLGDESQLSLDTMRVVGRIAVREAIRLKARNVSFAPVLRDQGNSTLDVGECDKAVIEGVVGGYDTEKRLQAQKLATPFSIAEWTIEAGPSFYNAAVSVVPIGIQVATERIRIRNPAPYRAAQP